MADTSPETHEAMPGERKAGLASVRSFVFLAYAITWGLLGPWFYVFNVVYHEKIPAWLWALAPLAFLGGWGPSIAALIVTARESGRRGVRSLLRTLVQWRVPLRWYVITLAVPPLLTAVSLLVVDRGPATLRQFGLGAALAHIPLAYAMALPFGPLGEELGWRGFALPRLLSRFGPVRASLLLGGIWTFWHVPMMLWSPGAAIPSFMGLSASSVLLYLVQMTSISVLMAVLFLRTRGSVLLAVLAHLAFNTAESILFGGVPDLTPDKVRAVYMVNVGLLAVFALIAIIWLAGRPTRSIAA